MRKIISSVLKRYWNLLLYGLIGLLSSSVDFCIYSILVMLHSDLFVANAIGVNIGIITSFSLNRRSNFKVKDHARLRFTSFYLIGMIGLAISTGILYLAVDIWDINEFYAKGITIILVAIIQFLLNKTITFRR